MSMIVAEDGEEEDDGLVDKAIILFFAILGYYHAHPIIKGTAICGCDTEALKASGRITH
jgi:hypothetical protein